MRAILQIIAIMTAMDAVLFGAAGRLDWTAAWVVTAMYAAFLLLILASAPPGLMEERSRTKAPNTKAWDIAIGIIYLTLSLAFLATAGLDARFHWSAIPSAAQVAAGVSSVAFGGVLWRTVAVNPFLSRFARIQDDRGQTVVQSGPYAYVRHPMYAAVIPLMLCIALMLGSLWTLIPAACIGVLLAVRTALEDRMLRRELPGYADYAQRVRYRLMPGLW